METLARKVASGEIKLEEALEDIMTWDWVISENPADFSIIAKLASKDRKHHFKTTIKPSFNKERSSFPHQAKIKATKELNRLVNEILDIPSLPTIDILRDMVKEGDVVIRYSDKKEFNGISKIGRTINDAYVLNSGVLDLLVGDVDKCTIDDDGFVSYDDGSFFFTINKTEIIKR